MKSRVKDFCDFVLSWLIIVPAVWLINMYGSLHELIKELYYRTFNIPYYKRKDVKGSNYVKRTDK